MARRGSGGATGLGTLFFLVGCAAILGVTFVTGVLTAMYWRPSRPLPSTAEALATPARRPAGVVAPADRALSSAPSAPTLTFYHELTAPLASPPVPAPPTPPAAVPSRTRASASGSTPSAALPAPVAPSSPAAPAPSRATAGTDGRFTIQVASYRTRQAADSLRESLAASGYDAYLVESPTPEGVRYRVRVGTFTTRQAATAAAARLTSQRPLAAYVTPR
jgi:cell division septation protein DedD